MEVQFVSGNLQDLATRVLVFFATPTGPTLDGNLLANDLLAPFLEHGEFGQDLGGSLFVYHPSGFKADRLLFVNLAKDVSEAHCLRRAAGRAWKELASKGFEELTFTVVGFDDHQARAALEGFILSDFQYQLRNDQESSPKRLKLIRVHGADDRSAAIQNWVHAAQATCRARELTQMPANILTPKHLAELVLEDAPAKGWHVTILDEEALRAESMGAILAVAQGSAQEPRLIVITYEPQLPEPMKTIALVGKAVTFDSGGLNLKLDHMEVMKGDKGGGATVVAIMGALQAMNCPHRVVGIVPAVENMISGGCIRPSDVVTSKAGLTVEVRNTDAEGRLILADAITYARRFNPDFVLDFGTLTGACVLGLGFNILGIMGSHQPLIDTIVRASWSLHEPFWQLPLFQDYKSFLESNIADISNFPSTPYGAAISAGLFLERFASGLNWVHCDIAGVMLDKPDDFSTAGGNGGSVRTLLEVLTGSDLKDLDTFR